MKSLGLSLLILGTVALVYGGIRYTRQKTVLQVGAFKATATERRTVPVSPIVGGILVLGGGLMLAVPKRKAV